LALSPWPLAFRRYHLSGANIYAKKAVVMNKDSISNIDIPSFARLASGAFYEGINI